MIPRDVAEKFRVVLFFEKEKEITITTDDPLADGLFEELKCALISPQLYISLGIMAIKWCQKRMYILHFLFYPPD